MQVPMKNSEKAKEVKKNLSYINFKKLTNIERIKRADRFLVRQKQRTNKKLAGKLTKACDFANCATTASSPMHSLINRYRVAPFVAMSY